VVQHIGSEWAAALASAHSLLRHAHHRLTSRDAAAIIAGWCHRLPLLAGSTQRRTRTLFSLRQQGTYRFSLFVFSLVERKNEKRQMKKVPLRHDYHEYHRNAVIDNAHSSRPRAHLSG
jgi:hypothetical protein